MARYECVVEASSTAKRLLFEARIRARSDPWSSRVGRRYHAARLNCARLTGPHGDGEHLVHPGGQPAALYGPYIFFADQPERVRVLVDVASHVTAAAVRGELLQRAELAARSLSQIFRAEAMLQCARASEQPARNRLVLEALMAMSDTTGPDRDLELLVPYLLDFEPAALGEAVEQALPIMASRTRARLAGDLKSLAPALFVLAAAAGMANLTDSLRKAATWWP